MSEGGRLSSDLEWSVLLLSMTQEDAYNKELLIENICQEWVSPAIPSGKYDLQQLRFHITMKTRCYTSSIPVKVVPLTSFIFPPLIPLL